MIPFLSFSITVYCNTVSLSFCVQQYVCGGRSVVAGQEQFATTIENEFPGKGWNGLLKDEFSSGRYQNRGEIWTEGIRFLCVP